MAQNTACQACSSDGAPFARIGDFSLQRCSSRLCGHVWVANPPDASALASFYDTAESRFENAGAFQRLTDYRRNPDAVRRYYHRDRIQHIHAHWPDAIGHAHGAVLDVGCSTGTFAAALRDTGLRVCGHDLNVQAVREGRTALGLDLCHDALPACEFGTKFDLVTCYDVIEHCADAPAFLDEIKSHMMAGARLVIRTPNHAGWLLALTRRRWLWYIPPAHLHYFNARSLSRLLERAGFVVEAIRTDASTYLYLIQHYLLVLAGRDAGGTGSLDMPAWQQRAVFGLDDFVRLAAFVPLRIAAARHDNPVLEVYARMVESPGPPAGPTAHMPEGRRGA